MDEVSFNIAELRLPVRLRLNAPMSDEELLRFSSANDALRIEQEANGELVVRTPTGGMTGRRNSSLSAALGNWAEQDGRGCVFGSSTGFRLPDGSVRSPDASWVQSSRWDALSEKEQEQYPPFCPQFVVELTSPTDILAEVRRKMVRDWMPNGVEVGWLIDVKSRTARIHRAGQPVKELVEPTTVQGTGPVRGFELEMWRVWG